MGRILIVDDEPQACQILSRLIRHLGHETDWKTGGADAEARGWAAGSVEVVSGSGLALVGLVAGTTYGSGDDQRVGAGLFVKSFPAASLPRLLELSGSATNLKIWAAGKAA